MFGIGWPELLLIVVVAVVVIGPKDLPHLLYNAGKLARKIRIIVSDIQKSLDAVVKEGELEEITREANKPGAENLQFEIERQIQEENKKTSAS